MPTAASGAPITVTSAAGTMKRMARIMTSMARMAARKTAMIARQAWKLRDSLRTSLTSLTSPHSIRPRSSITNPTTPTSRLDTAALREQALT